jgi:hypothetical protein
LPDSAYGCFGTVLNDYVRQLIVSAHNEFRESLANGLEPNSCGMMPASSSIYKMVPYGKQHAVVDRVDFLDLRLQSGDIRRALGGQREIRIFADVDQSRGRREHRSADQL